MPSSGKLSQIASRLRRDLRTEPATAPLGQSAGCPDSYAVVAERHRRELRAGVCESAPPFQDLGGRPGSTPQGRGCGHPRGWAGEHQGGAHQGVAGGDLAGAGPLRPQLSPGRVGRGGPRLPGSVQGRRPHDDRLRPAVRVGPSGVSGGHPRPPRLSATGSSQRTTGARERGGIPGAASPTPRLPGAPRASGGARSRRVHGPPSRLRSVCTGGTVRFLPAVSRAAEDRSAGSSPDRMTAPGARYARRLAPRCRAVSVDRGSGIW